MQAKTLVGLPALMMLYACSSADTVLQGNDQDRNALEESTAVENVDLPADAAPPEGPDVHGSVVELAQVELNYGGRVDFSSFRAPDGTLHVGIGEAAPADIVKTPLEMLLEKEKPTTLEVFHAIAPGREPPAELLEAHPSEAARLGRSDALRALQFDEDAPIQKSVSGCEDWVYRSGYSWTNKRSRNWAHLTNTLPVGDDYNHWTLGTVTLGFCNESPFVIYGNMAWDYHHDGLGDYWDNQVSLPGGYRYRWSLRNYSSCVTWWDPSSPWQWNQDCTDVKYYVWTQAGENRLYHQKTALLSGTDHDCVDAFPNCSGGGS